MGALQRGVRNIARSSARTTLVVALVALSVAVVGSAVAASTASGEQAQRLRRDVGTLIQVNPFGVAPGGFGVASGLPASLTVTLRGVEGVVAVEPYLRRGFQDNTKPVQGAVLNGALPGSELRLSAMGGFTSTPRLAEGRVFRAGEEDAAVAVVGRVFAQQNGLRLGSSFTIPASRLRGAPTGLGQDLEARVIGIFSVNVAFGDNQVFMPLAVAQRAVGTPDEVSQFWVRAAGAERVPQVAADLSRLLADKADVLVEAPQARRAAASVATVGSNALVTAAVAAVVGALVVLLAMVLVTRERRREIGVLKALGAPTRTVAAQFVAESLALSTLGVVLGAGLALAAGELLTRVVVGGADQFATYRVAPSALGTAALLATASGLVGSLYPLQRSVRLRPADAIRGLE